MHLKVVDAIANEGTKKIEQWWSKMSAAKEAEELLSKIDEVAPSADHLLVVLECSFQRPLQ